MPSEQLRERVEWSTAYNPEWDSSPDMYVDAGTVSWGKSRRLGMFHSGVVKAYLGVQHIDPSIPGWSFVEQPEARFFLSLFISGQVVTLRTFPTVDTALGFLADYVERSG